MKTYRSMTAAAVLAAAGTLGALSIGSALGQQGTQPGQRPPTTPPGQTQPGERPTTPPGQTQPGQRPTTPPGQQSGMNQSERIFALEGAGAERKVTELSSRLSRIEQQMAQTNQDLARRISQFDTLEGEQKIDAISEVLEEVVNEHEQLHTYLVALRSAMTGEASSPGTNTPRPTTPGTQPGSQPGTQPGQRPPTTPPGGQPPR